MKIAVDYREKASGLIQLLSEADLSLEVKKIPYGDYVINEKIIVERKTARDFLISIIDGRLFSQLSNLKKHSQNPIMIIEGNPFQEDIRIDPNAIKGALVSIQAIWYIPALFSRSKEETRDILLMIGRQEETNSDEVQLRGGYRPRRLKSKQLFILQGLPKVGPTMAKRLLEHFRSVSSTMNASVQELTEVEGVGEATAQTIRQTLDAEYQ
jgi:Fanconi anemia group M protein